MRKNFLILMLLALLPLAGFAAELVGSTQYDTDGFQYVIKSMTKDGSTWKGTVSVKQNIFSGAALTIKDQVSINVEGTVLGEECKQTVTFDVVEIEADGFKDVKTITSITIGNKIKTIGEGAFAGCENVTAISFKANTNNMTIGNDAFKATKPTVVDLSPITGTLEAVNKWWDNSPFVSGTEVNSTLTTITFPKKVAFIAEDAFAGFTALTTVNFTAATDAEAVLLTIAGGAFQETPIVKLDLTNARITTLNRLFEFNNVTLKKVVMSKYVVTLAENALADCIQLGREIVADELGAGSPAEEGGVDFSQSTKLKFVKAGSLSNTVVATYDFSNCCELNTAGNAYTSFLNFEVGENPFVNGTTKTNKNLVTVVLPKKLAWSPVNEIGTVFANCEVLATITNLDVSKITKVEDGAFANDINLPALSFPNTLATVTGAPFAGCKKLATLTFDGTALTQLGTEAADAVPDVMYTEAECNTANASITGFAAAGELVGVAATMTTANGYSKDYADAEALADNAVDIYLYNTNIGAAGADPSYIKTTNVKTPGTPAVAGQELFGDFIYDGVAFDSPLTTLTINVAADATTSVKINEKAFYGQGIDAKSSLKNLSIAVGGKFAGTIAKDAITLTSKENSVVAFGEIAGATFNKIQGVKGTNTATLTIDKYTSATLTGAPVEPIIAGTISTATIKGEVASAGGNVLSAIGQAQVINFQGNINPALQEPGYPNAVLTTLNFHNALLKGVVIGTQIPAKVFNEDNAPLLTAVNWIPEAATKAFNIATFGTSSVGEVAATVTLTTSPEVAALYEKKESKLYHVKFVAADVPAVPVEIEVYGNATADYFYGKYEISSPSSRLAIAKTNDDGDQVEVYTAFVDTKDQKIYMDRLSLKDGEYVIAEDQPVIIRVKNPTTTETWSKVSGGLLAKVKAYETKKYSTMRYLKTGSSSYKILNDLQITDKVFSSDYIGTNYVGKTLYAMANPGKVGTLQFDPVAKTSYLPKGALFVETVEASSAAPLEIVWLDGDENLTGIIERISEDKAALNNVIYNLAGQKVGADYKGIIIKNGKKFVVK